MSQNSRISRKRLQEIDGSKVIFDREVLSGMRQSRGEAIDQYIGEPSSSDFFLDRALRR